MGDVDRVELLQNSKFYVASTVDTDSAEHFESYETTGTASFDWYGYADYSETGVNVFSQEGGGFLKIDSSSSFTGGYRTIFKIKVEASTVYNLSALIKTRLTSGTVKAIAYWFDSNGDACSSASGSASSFTGTMDWSKSVGQLTSPSDAAYARIHVLVTAGVGEVWIDNLSFSRHYVAYITSAQFTDHTRLSVGTSSSDVLTDNFNEQLPVASLQVEKDTGKRWEYTQDKQYEIIQRLTALYTAHLCQSAHQGVDVPNDLLGEGVSTIWKQKYDELLASFFALNPSLADTTKADSQMELKV